MIKGQVIFKYIDPRARYIAKDKNEEVNWYEKRPYFEVGDDEWNTKDAWGLLGCIQIEEFEEKHWEDCILTKEPDYNKWIGCLCYFWNEEIYSPLNNNSGKPRIDILSSFGDYKENDGCRFMGRAIGWYKNCLPVKSSEIKFFENN